MTHKGIINANPNYKTYARIIEQKGDDNSMLTANFNINQISIKDPNNSSAEINSFTFDKIFDNNATQEGVFQALSQQCLEKMIEGLFNF